MSTGEAGGCLKCTSSALCRLCVWTYVTVNVHFCLANMQPPHFLSFPLPQAASMNLIFVLWLLASVSYRGKCHFYVLFSFYPSFSSLDLQFSNSSPCTGVPPLEWKCMLVYPAKDLGKSFRGQKAWKEKESLTNWGKVLIGREKRADISGADVVPYFEFSFV